MAGGTKEGKPAYAMHRVSPTENMLGKARRIYDKKDLRKLID